MRVGKTILGISVTVALLAGCGKSLPEDTSAADGAMNVDRAKVTAATIGASSGRDVACRRVHSGGWAAAVVASELFGDRPARARHPRLGRPRIFRRGLRLGVPVPRGRRRLRRSEPLGLRVMRVGSL